MTSKIVIQVAAVCTILLKTLALTVPLNNQVSSRLSYSDGAFQFHILSMWWKPPVHMHIIYLAHCVFIIEWKVCIQSEKAEANITKVHGAKHDFFQHKTYEQP